MNTRLEATRAFVRETERKLAEVREELAQLEREEWIAKNPQADAFHPGTLLGQLAVTNLDRGSVVFRRLEHDSAGVRALVYSDGGALYNASGRELGLSVESLLARDWHRARSVPILNTQTGVVENREWPLRGKDGAK